MYGVRRNAGAVRVALAAVLLAIALFWLGGRIAGAIRAALIAMVIAYLADPLVSCFEKKLPRPLAAACAFLAVILFAVSLVLAVVIPALSQLSHLPDYILAAGKRLEGVLRDLERPLSDFGIGFSAADIFPKAENAAQFGKGLISFLISGVGSLAAAVSGMAAVFALSYFFLLDWKNFSVRIQLFVPSRFRNRAIKAALCVRRELGAYLRGQTLIILLLSAITVCALYLLKSPIPLAMGLMYGMMNAIPYFGPLVGVIPPVASALAVGWQQALFTLGALLLIQQIDNYAISPRVMGAVAGASPAMVLFAIAAGSSLLGVTGMFLALPALVSAKAVYRVFAAGEDDTET